MAKNAHTLERLQDEIQSAKSELQQLQPFKELDFRYFKLLADPSALSAEESQLIRERYENSQDQLKLYRSSSEHLSSTLANLSHKKERILDGDETLSLERLSLRRRLDLLPVQVADAEPIPMNQGPASGFAVSAQNEVPFQEICVQFSTVWGTATTHERLQSRFPLTVEVPAERLESVDRLLESTFLDTFNFCIVHESSKLKPQSPERERVQADHLTPIAKSMSSFRSLGNSEWTLNALGCPSGIASEGSIPDGCGMKPIIRGDECTEMVAMIFEAKHNTDAPLQGFTQAAAAATNAGLAIGRRGVPMADIRIPICATNGQLMKFGFVQFLEPVFPMIEVLTSTLDLSDATRRREAALVLCHLHQWLCQPLACSLPERPALVLAYSTELYHYKPLSNFFCTQTFLNTSLRHFFLNLDRLKSNPECLSCCELPLTIQTTGDSGRLVFHNLTKFGYRIGLPPTRELRVAFMTELRRAVALVHSVGVVHLDLYLSNIMWKLDERDGRMRIKIIDWDSCHRLGDALSDPTIGQLQSRYEKIRNGSPIEALYSATRAVEALDVLLLDILELNLDCAKLQSDQKRQLDTEFFGLLIS